MLMIYLTDVDGVPDEAQGLPLSSYRLHRLGALQQPRARRQTIAAELLLIRALRESGAALELPLDIHAQLGGKPFLAVCPWHFSISHSGSFAACALSDHEIGLDIQEERGFPKAFLSRFFHADEQRYVLDAEDREKAFCEIWTRKESLLKLNGTGLYTTLASFSCLDLPAGVSGWHTETDRLHIAVSSQGAKAEPDRICVLSAGELLSGLTYAGGRG
ncbi:MAG: 4'-phosphopantetheinyl transferase superfamily protein [Oscillospiraceae bacterium]|nr:4'-phosphopantetheinyl transferase superfamily protein [Oscillospiraceae bacterium]